ncbi:MAG: hypothetical protein ACPGYX_07180 [Oceanobacter sp.]
MSSSRQIVENLLYEFDPEYRVSYVSFNRASDLTDSQLVLTVENGLDRKTFSFSQPLFNDIDKNLVSTRGLYIAAVKSTPFSSNRVEVGDIEGQYVFFSARSVKNITPSA